MMTTSRLNDEIRFISPYSVGFIYIYIYQSFLIEIIKKRVATVGC